MHAEIFREPLKEIKIEHIYFKPIPVGKKKNTDKRQNLSIIIDEIKGKRKRRARK